jgi:predicted transcriptional regulator
MILVQPGQFITGRKQLAKILHQNESTVRKRLNKLSKLGYINIKSTNKFSIVTVIIYETYQSSEINKEQQSNNRLTTEEHQSDTNNKDKELSKNNFNKKVVNFIKYNQKPKYGQSKQVRTPTNNI